MGRIKHLFRLILILAVGLVIYAMVADLPPPTEAVSIPLAIPAGAGQ